MDWLRLLKSRYRHTVWLNPSRRPAWSNYWGETYDLIAREFPMFPLTVEGLEEAMKKLLVRGAPVFLERAKAGRGDPVLRPPFFSVPGAEETHLVLVFLREIE